MKKKNRIFFLSEKYFLQISFGWNNKFLELGFLQEAVILFEKSIN